MNEKLDEDRKQKSGKLVLDLELQDILDLASKTNPRSTISESLSNHVIESEALKKAWFKHVLLSLEKLDDYLETTRNVEIPQLRAELRKEIYDLKLELKEIISELKVQVVKDEEAFSKFKVDKIEPMSTNLTVLKVKVAMFAAGCGFLGGGLMALIIYLLRDYILKGMLGN